MKTILVFFQCARNRSDSQFLLFHRFVVGGAWRHGDLLGLSGVVKAGISAPASTGALTKVAELD
jgi:hypothetical protein